MIDPLYYFHRMYDVMGLFSRKKKVDFLATPKKTKTKRPVKFETKDGPVEFNARRKPQRRVRVKFKAKKD